METAKQQREALKEIDIIKGIRRLDDNTYVLAKKKLSDIGKSKINKSQKTDFGHNPKEGNPE